ncbi:MAG: hypothetical protein GY778_25195 [bacterium]|nr:hypothetical protein [bacterium]
MPDLTFDRILLEFPRTGAQVMSLLERFIDALAEWYEADRSLIKLRCLNSLGRPEGTLIGLRSVNDIIQDGTTALARGPLLEYDCTLRQFDQHETWRLVLYLTKVPHFGGDRMLGEHRFRQREWGILQSLLTNGVADVVQIDSRAFKDGRRYLRGTKVKMYVIQKMLMVRKMQRRYFDEPYADSGVEIGRFMGQLAAAFGSDAEDGEEHEIQDNVRAIREFLRGCDDELRNAHGTDFLKPTLKALGVSLKRWMSNK